MRRLRIAALRHLRLFRVNGDSMMPGLPHGTWLAVDTGDRRLPVPGEVVVVRAPDSGRRIVKRVRSVGEDTFSVGSDAPWEARDSRQFGSLSTEHLVGKVVFPRHA